MPEKWKKAGVLPAFFRINAQFADYDRAVVSISSNQVRHMKLNFFVAFASLFFSGFSSVLLAQYRDSELEKSGLVYHWEGSLGGARAINRANSVLIWPHTKKNHEVVRVKVSGKLVGTFYGDQIDQSVLENSLFEDKSDGKQPRLGMKGAQREAEKLAKKYQILGKKVDVEAEEPIPVVYLIAVNQLGALSVLDAENGTLIWRVQLPNGTLPVFGPGASDDYVVVTDGSELLVYDIHTGRTVMNRPLEFVPTGQPTVFAGKAIVPSVGGRAVIYDVKNPKERTITLRIGSENRFGIAKSADQYLAWPVDSKLVIAQTTPEILLLTSFDTRSRIHAKPVAVDNGFITVSESGNVVRCRNNKAEPLMWQTRLGSTCKQSPVVGKKIVTVITDNNQIFALNMEDGSEIWRSPTASFQSITTVTESRVYACERSGNVVILNAETGKMEGRISIGQYVSIANSVSDRLLFSAKDGRIVCLREKDAKTPSFHFANKPAVAETPAPVEEEVEVKAADTPVVDPFGSPDLPMSDTPASDPFGSGKDPF
jgi:outer membrane protein assembly factor BamB